MSSTTTKVNILSQALRNLGEDAVTTAELTTTRRGKIADEFYVTTRDALLHEHPWSFAKVRTALYAYTDPTTTITPGAVTGTGVTFTAGAVGTFALTDVDRQIWNTAADGKAKITSLVSSTPAATLTPGAVSGTGITFTASAAVFEAGHVGRILRNDSGDGEATITGFTDTTHVVATVSEAFPSTTAIASGSWSLVQTDAVLVTVLTDFPSTSAIASGSWRLYYRIPTWGLAYSIPYPTDALRVWRLEDMNDEFHNEDGYIITDETSLNVVYIKQETDTTVYPQTFVEALVARLTMVLCKPITGRFDGTELWAKLYSHRLATAKAMNGQEGTPESFESTVLTDVRF